MTHNKERALKPGLKMVASSKVLLLTIKRKDRANLPGLMAATTKVVS
jgi:hypothetical protein